MASEEMMSNTSNFATDLMVGGVLSEWNEDSAMKIGARGESRG
jgi:hypothetical protein